jgi:anti-sigma B factor antagonist
MKFDSNNSIDEEACFEVKIPPQTAMATPNAPSPAQTTFLESATDSQRDGMLKIAGAVAKPFRVLNSKAKPGIPAPMPVQAMMVFTKEASKPGVVNQSTLKSKNSISVPKKGIIKTGIPSKSSELISLARLQEIMVLLKEKNPTVASAMLNASPQSETPHPPKKRDQLSIFNPIQASPENPGAHTPLRVENEGFSIRFIQKNGKPEYSVFAFEGAVDTTQQKTIDEFFDRCVAESVFHVVCDLTGVVFINSSGWGAFVSHLQRMRKLGGNVFLCGMQSPIDDSFRLLELDKLFSTHRSLDDCKKSIEEDYSRATAANSLPMPRGAAAVDIPISLDDKIAAIIAEDPDLANRQILKRLQSQDYGQTKIGLHELTVNLRSMDLLTKEKRYRFFRSL